MYIWSTYTIDPCWYEANGVMIVFIILFITNVLQKPTLTIIIFFILCEIMNISGSWGVGREGFLAYSLKMGQKSSYTSN
jgi:hypothetical protein